MAIVYRIFISLCLTLVSAIWMPPTKFSPNFDQFQLYKTDNLKDVLNKSFLNGMTTDFSWQSVASVSLSGNNVSYIIYGGSQPVQNHSQSAFSRRSSTVVFCELSYSERESTFVKVNCRRADTRENNWYLGATIQALSLSKREAVIVYCDPLWHFANISGPKASGKCYINLIKDAKIVKNASLEFCRLSSTSFESCLGGFSIDLISTNKDISGIEMLVGMPHLTPFGSAKIVKDPFSSQTRIDTRNNVGKYFNFGYAVAMITTSVAYASSPLSDHYGPNVTNIRENFVLTSPDNSPFSSFGLALKTLSLSVETSHAVIIGAPFHSYKSIQNVGKTYVYCVSKTNIEASLTAQLHGEKKDEFYGYALANIGDINGDKNDDFAISSPFLRDDNGQGFVSIYTVGSQCEVNSKPHQVLRSSPLNNNAIFGLAISGGYDLDFNGWPDIVILDSRSNSIQLYGSRKRYEAKCSYSIESTYEKEPLKEDDEISVRIHWSLMDTRKMLGVDLNLLNNFRLLSQLDPNFNSSETRFEVVSKPKFTLTESLVIAIFQIKSLMHVKLMNLSTPLMVAYRLLEDCSDKECNNLMFPLIDWDFCTAVVPIKKFVCFNLPCNADLSITLSDSEGTEIVYGNDKTFSRSLELKLSNAGPSEGKDVNFKVSTYQNIRIHSINARGTVSLKQVTAENQTVTICKLDQEQFDVGNGTVVVDIDIYFENFKDSERMNYTNNSVIVSVFSEVKDENLLNNVATMNYEFVYEPNVTFSGSPSKDTVIDSRNRSQLIREGQRLAIDTIGPRLSQRYVVENSGNATITNMVIKVSIPLQTQDGFYILYLFDKIRGVNGSEAIWMSIMPHVFVGTKQYPCSLSNKYINPLNILGFETHQLHLSNIDSRQMSDSLHFIKKRSVDTIVGAQASSADDNIKMTQGKMYRIPVEIVQCDRTGVNLKSPICAEMQCHIPILPPNKLAKLQINAWLWAHTFFKKQISDILIYTTLRTDFTDLPSGIKLRIDKSKSYSQSQQFIFQNVKPKITHFKPWWPIIVGIVIGILILAILIVAMYKCGFFQRNKIRRRFKGSRKEKKRHVIIHPGDMHTMSSVSSDTKFTSHSALIN